MNPAEEEIERIRGVRRRISAACGDDPRRLVAYYRQVSDALRATGRYRFAKPPASKPVDELLMREEPPKPPASDST